MNTTSRILGEATRNVRPPTKKELTDPDWAYHYARDVIKGRWPEGEPAIATHPGYVYLYAKDVIRGRWPEAEAAIATNPKLAYHYAKDVIGGRWPEAEATIAKIPVWAGMYAIDVIGGRWPEVEAAIATEPSNPFIDLSKSYIDAFPEAKLDWAMNGLIDWTDL